MAKVTASDIKSIVCARYDLTRSDLEGVSKSKAVSRARHVAFYLTRQHCKHLSSSAVGRLYGGRDHATVIIGAQNIDRNDDDVRELTGAVMALENGCEKIASLIAKRDIQARRICIEIARMADVLTAIEAGYEVEEQCTLNTNT